MTGSSYTQGRASFIEWAYYYDNNLTVVETNTTLCISGRGWGAAVISLMMAAIRQQPTKSIQLVGRHKPQKPDDHLMDLIAWLRGVHADNNTPTTAGRLYVFLLFRRRSEASSFVFSPRTCLGHHIPKQTDQTEVQTAPCNHRIPSFVSSAFLRLRFRNQVPPSRRQRYHCARGFLLSSCLLR